MNTGEILKKVEEECNVAMECNPYTEEAVKKAVQLTAEDILEKIDDLQNENDGEKFYILEELKKSIEGRGDFKEQYQNEIKELKKAVWICPRCKISLKHRREIHTFICPKCNYREWYPYRIGDFEMEVDFKVKQIISDFVGEFYLTLQTIMHKMEDERNRYSDIIPYIKRKKTKLAEKYKQEIEK